MYQGDTFSRLEQLHGPSRSHSSWCCNNGVILSLGCCIQSLPHTPNHRSFPSPDATWAPISIYVAVYWGLLHGLRSHAPRAREFPATISFGFPTHRTCGMGLTLSFSPPTFFPAPVPKVSHQLPFNWCFTLIYLVQEVDGDSNFLLANAFLT